MEKLKPYRVTKGSSDRTFTIDEIIWKSENGDINSVQAKGWITPSEVMFEYCSLQSIAVKKGDKYGRSK